MNPAAALLTVSALDLASAQALALELEEAWTAPSAISLNETDEARRLWGLVACYETLALAEAAAEDLRGRGHAATAEPLQDEDWVRRSLQGLAPVHAGRFQLYGSHDRPNRRAGGIGLEIDAGTAFGTGHHGTTAGCLAALDAVLKHCRPMRVLDVGCGTGVLALAAAAALKRRVTASDIDPVAVAVAQDNARINGLSPRLIAITAVGLSHRVIAAGAPYDLIFANILAGPLVALAGDIVRALAPRGRAILSGLTMNQIRQVSGAYLARGLSIERRIIRDPWAVLVLAKQQ